MDKRFVFPIVMATIVVFIVLAGCTSPSGNPPATQTPVPTTIQTPVPATTAPVVTTTVKATVTAAKTETYVEEVVLHQKGMLSPTSFQTYDLQTTKDQFSQIGTKYKVTIKADKPVIGYAVTTAQSDVLHGSEFTPQYVPSSEKIQWGLITPYMAMGKVTEATTKTFTIDKIAPYVYVVDGRWMGFDDSYKSTPPFNYEITITKIYNPIPTPNVANS